MIHFQLLFVMVWAMALNEYFCTWISNCLSTICWNCFTFLIELLQSTGYNEFSWGQRYPISYIPLQFDDGLLQRVPRFMVWWVKQHTFYEGSSSNMVTSWHAFKHSASTTETWVSKCNCSKILNVFCASSLGACQGIHKTFLFSTDTSSTNLIFWAFEPRWVASFTAAWTCGFFPLRYIKEVLTFQLHLI